MYPMDFEEFLLACGEQDLIEMIAEAYRDRKPLPEGIHGKALYLYRDYLFTGGMPEAVLSYVRNGKNLAGMDRSIQKNLQLAYLANMNKYVIRSICRMWEC